MIAKIGRKLHGRRVLRRVLSSASASSKGTATSGLSGLLTNEQRVTLGEVHELASQTRNLARDIGRVAIKEDSLLSDIARLKDDESSSPSLFTIVLCGEFNAGKSTLVNALLGVELLDSGVLPTTDKITIVLADDDNHEGNGSISGGEVVDSGIKRVYLLPSSKYPILEDLAVVDTPGSNACLSLEHTSTTLKILHDADLILFVTSADRPFGESEKEILASIKSYRKRVALVINKMDILERQQGEDHGDESKQKVEDYVVEHASEFLGARPVVIPVSARDALSFKLLGGGSSGQSSLWRRSNFESLEQYLSETLTAKAKIKTKLLNPLGVSEGILKDCRDELLRRAEDLEIDQMTLKLLISQTDLWQKEIETTIICQCLEDVKRALRRRAEVASGVVHSLSLIDKLQLGLGIGRQPFEIAWQERMSRPPVNDELQSILEKCIKSLMSRAEHQASTTIEYLGKRPAIIGSSHGVNRMIGTVRKAKFREPSKTDKTIELVTANLPVDSESSRALYSSLVRTSFLSFFLSAGSVLVPGSLVMSGSLDVDSAVAYGASCAALGGVSLPLGNHLTIRSFEKQWKTTQIGELESLLKDFMGHIRSELDESIAPYSRFVRSHGDTIRVSNAQLDDCIAISISLRSKINKVCK